MAGGRFEYGVDQAGKPGVKIISAQLHETPCPFPARPGDPGAAQDLKVMAQRRVGDGCIQLAPSTLDSVGQHPDQPEPYRVSEGRHDRDQIDLAAWWMMSRAHDPMLHSFDD